MMLLLLMSVRTRGSFGNFWKKETFTCCQKSTVAIRNNYDNR